jgi:beta-glucanase (GH16 family)
MRRYIVVAAVLAILAGTASVGSGAELSVAHGGSADVVTAVASRPVASPGEFRVVVSLRANKRSETAVLYVPGEPERSLRLRAHRATTIAFKLVLKASTKKLRVRAVSPRPGVQLTLKLKREASRGASGGAPGGASLPSSGDAVTIPGASAGSPGGGTTPGSGLTTPDPGSTTPAPQAPDPYTKLLLDDEFAGAQGAPADSDGADLSEDVGDGDCGGGTVNTNTTSAANAALDGNGDLAITALDNGSGAYPYTSAQLESSFSDEYGAVEARIEVPPGQGLCSAFWLNGDPTLGDPPVSAPCSWPGCGEIDILEDPAFVGAQYPQYPPYSIFTIHGPISDGADQQFESALPNAGSIGDPTSGFHTYGIIWSPGSIVWTIDGVAYASATPAEVDAYVAQNDPGSSATWEFDSHNEHVILDLAVGGWPGTPTGDNASEFPATMLINWVRWYGCQTGTPQTGCT